MRIMQVIDYGTFGEGYIDAAVKAAKHADIIWFRIKTGDIRVKAAKLREALPDAFLSLSLDACTAAELGYQAVQLGFGADIAGVRAKHPGLKIGYSAHSISEIENTDADFYTLSPVFFTEKDYEVKPLGPQDVSALGKEVYALGGINADNISELRGFGFAGVAGISFVDELAEIKAQAL